MSVRLEAGLPRSLKKGVRRVRTVYSLQRLLLAFALGSPALASATLFTLTIEGVDPAVIPTVTLGTPNPLLPGMFVGLGDCGQGVSGACDGNPPIDNNPLASPADVSDANFFNAIV